MPRTQELGQILGQNIITLGAAHATVKMIMEEKVNGFDIWQFESVLGWRSENPE